MPCRKRRRFRGLCFPFRFHIGLLILLVGLPLPGIAGPSLELFQAVTRNDVSRVEALIEAGVDVNARDEQGRTPLDLADTLEMIEVLRKAGAMTAKELDEGDDDSDEEWEMCCAPPIQPVIPEA